LRKREVQERLAEKVQGYPELLIEEKVTYGTPVDKARREALMKLGGEAQVKQAVRNGRAGTWLESFVMDLRYGLRTLRKSPGFACVAVLTLGVGIGACTAVFSLVNAVLLRALPYGDAGQLVYLYTPIPSDPNFKSVPLGDLSPPYADYVEIARQSKSYASTTAFLPRPANLATLDNAQRVGVAKVDARFFGTLEVAPELGRGIDAADDAPSEVDVVVISHGVWQSMFAGSPDILTKTLRLDGRNYRVIGVMHAEFGYPHDYDLAKGENSVKSTDAWVPLVLTAQQKRLSVYTVARLKQKVSVQQAQAELTAIMARLDLIRMSGMRNLGALVKPFEENAVGGMRPLMRTLFTAVVLVLLIACGNAANLLLARAASRMHELGVRATLGASRGRVMRQMLTESLLLGMAGGVIGILLAYGSVRGILRLNPGNVPRMEAASLDARVLGFTVLVAIMTSVLFGILPALSVSRTNLVEFLKAGGNRGNIRAGGRLQSKLIVCEVALVVVMLAGAGLLLRSYINVAQVPAGFSLSTVSASVQLDPSYGQPTQRLNLLRRVLDGMGAIPGVQSVGMISSLPLTRLESMSMLEVEGYANGGSRTVLWRTVTEGYFTTMEIPFMAGRSFQDGDTADGLPVAIVNQAFAKRYFNQREPIGRRIRTSGPGNPWRTVVGVVANIQDASMEAVAEPEVFQPVWQTDFFRGTIVLRTSLPRKDVAAMAHTTLRKIDPNLAWSDIRTMGELVSESTALRRFQTMLLLVFAGVALMLSLVGFYGLLTYSVKRRTAEIGLRIALGSPRGRVLRMVVRQGLSVVVTGLLLGLGVALVLTRVLAASLYQVKPVDPVTFVAVPALMLIVTVAASLIPGWQALRVEPVSALRCE
jgi:predicted permease